VNSYLLTFSCYGSKVNGEEGTVDRAHNAFGSRLPQPIAVFEAQSRRLMAQAPYDLDIDRRSVVLQGLLTACSRRGWILHAAHVRSTHVHAVVSAACAPELVLNSMKAYASRALNVAGFDNPDRRRWTRHGSTRYLWTDEAKNAAIQYVLHEQGELMAVYEKPPLPGGRGSD
jgi:hypothetical protein